MWMGLPSLHICVEFMKRASAQAGGVQRAVYICTPKQDTRSENRHHHQQQQHHHQQQHHNGAFERLCVFSVLRPTLSCAFEAPVAAVLRLPPAFVKSLQRARVMQDDSGAGGGSGGDAFEVYHAKRVLAADGASGDTVVCVVLCQRCCTKHGVYMLTLARDSRLLCDWPVRRRVSHDVHSWRLPRAWRTSWGEGANDGAGEQRTRRCLWHDA
jgi:hypothetical protein